MVVIGAGNRDLSHKLFEEKSIRYTAWELLNP